MTEWMRKYCPGQWHLLFGNDGSGRHRLIVSRWYVEVTVFGRYVNMGRL